MRRLFGRLTGSWPGEDAPETSAGAGGRAA
jgi:hypothetical protein